MPPEKSLRDDVRDVLENQDPDVVNVLIERVGLREFLRQAIPLVEEEFLNQEDPTRATPFVQSQIEKLKSILRERGILTEDGEVADPAFRKESEEIDSLTEFARLWEANRIRAGNIREILDPLRRLLNADPNKGRRLKGAQRRNQELRRGPFDLSEKQLQRRIYAPGVAQAVSLSRGETRQALRVAAEMRTRETVEYLKKTRYIPMTIVGTGPAGQAFANKYLNENPRDGGGFVMCDIDLGGQFNYADAQVHQLNNRTKPISDEEALPGTRGDLTRLGSAAPFDVADISGTSYAGNTDVGLVNALNVIAATRNLLIGYRLESVRMNTDKRFPGRYVITQRDLRTGTFLEYGTDIIIYGTGTGESSIGLEELEDADTQDIVVESRKKTARGEFADYMDFFDYSRIVGGRSLFPKEVFKGKTVVFIGFGDSAKVGALGLLGLGEFDPRLSVTNLDYNPEIKCIGAKARTKEEICAIIRSRYLSLVGEIPKEEEREEIERAGVEYFRRLACLAGRAVRLKRNDRGELCVVYRDAQGEEQIVENVVVIDTSGQYDTTDLTLSTLRVRRSFTPRTITPKVVREALQKQGADFSFVEDDIARATVQRVIQPKEGTAESTRIILDVSLRDGTQATGVVILPKDENAPVVCRCRGQELELTDRLFAGITVPDVPSRVPVADTSRNLGAAPFGEALDGEDIIFIGACSNQDLQLEKLFGAEGARRIRTALRAAAENVKSLFIRMALVDQAPSPIAEARRKDGKQPLPARGRSEQKISIVVSPEDAKSILTFEVEVSESARKVFNLPDESSEILILQELVHRLKRFSVKAADGDELTIDIRFDGEKSFSVAISPNVPSGEFRDAVEEAFTNPVIQMALLNYAHVAAYRGKKGLSIKIPLTKRGELLCADGDVLKPTRRKIRKGEPRESSGEQEFLRSRGITRE